MCLKVLIWIFLALKKEEHCTKSGIIFTEFFSLGRDQTLPWTRPQYGGGTPPHVAFDCSLLHDWLTPPLPSEWRAGYWPVTTDQWPLITDRVVQAARYTKLYTSSVQPSLLCSWQSYARPPWHRPTRTDIHTYQHTNTTVIYHSLNKYKKAVLSQRWPPDARYISRSWAVAEIWPFEIIQDGGSGQLEFVRIENSAIRSAVPEKPL